MQITPTVRSRLTRALEKLAEAQMEECPMRIALDHTAARGGLRPDAGAYASASEEMAWRRLTFLARTAAERRRRNITRLLDAAMDRCERRNLAAAGAMRGQPDLTPPPEVAALIQRLQVRLHWELRPPHTNQEALDELFELQRAFMPYCDDEDGDADGIAWGRLTAAAGR
jgi:hypothetical protein